MAPILGPEPARPETERSIEEDALLTDRLDRVEEEKREALKDPGPTWKEWWYYQASKWYVLIGLLVVDVWAFAEWADLANQGSTYLWIPGSVSLVLLAYGEFLLYSYLYYRPEDRAGGRRRSHRPSWLQPFAVGRWTPEGALRRSGVPLAGDEGPSPDEFL